MIDHKFHNGADEYKKISYEANKAFYDPDKPRIRDILWNHYDRIEKTVLMKRERCLYQEEVPVSTLETLKNLPPVSDVYKIMCPFCLNDMYEADSVRFTKQ